MTSGHHRDTIPPPGLVDVPGEAGCCRGLPLLVNSLDFPVGIINCADGQGRSAPRYRLLLASEVNGFLVDVDAVDSAFVSYTGNPTGSFSGRMGS